MYLPFARCTFWAVAVGLAVAGGLGAGETTRPAAQITVVFEAPEKFTDVKDSYTGDDSGRDNYLTRLKEHLQKRAGARLEPGQKLAVTFTDIDLAGDFEPWRGIRFDDIRVLREIYPPRMKLAFTLTDADGKIVKQGERSLTDGAYLLSKPGFSDDELRYDKKLLDDWLRAEFPHPLADDHGVGVGGSSPRAK